MDEAEVESVLRHDRRFAELLESREEYVKKWHLVPQRSVPTDGGFFGLYMCNVDWSHPGGPLGSDVWEAYSGAAGFEMLFTDLSVGEVSSTVSAAEPEWICHQDTASHPLKSEAIALLVFRVKNASWTIVSRAFHSDRDTGLLGIANVLHERAGGIVKGISGRDLIELKSGEEPGYESYPDWEDLPHNTWLTNRSIAVPPFRCSTKDGHFHMWLAGIPPSAILRLDVFTDR